MSNIRLRKVELGDMSQLYRWRNDPDVRRWSFNKQEVLLEEHKKWFQTCLNRDDVAIFILEEDGQAVGQIRLTYWYDELVIGYSIDRNCRGRHLGQQIVERMEKLLRASEKTVNILWHMCRKKMLFPEEFFKCWDIVRKSNASGLNM